ncbi:MAG: PAS domain S-box protein [Halobacteriota archaeon]
MTSAVIVPWEPADTEVVATELAAIGVDVVSPGGDWEASPSDRRPGLFVFPRLPVSGGDRSTTTIGDLRHRYPSTPVLWYGHERTESNTVAIADVIADPRVLRDALSTLEIEAVPAAGGGETRPTGTIDPTLENPGTVPTTADGERPWRSSALRRVLDRCRERFGCPAATLVGRRSDERPQILAASGDRSILRTAIDDGLVDAPDESKPKGRFTNGGTVVESPVDQPSGRHTTATAPMRAQQAALDTWGVSIDTGAVGPTTAWFVGQKSPDETGTDASPVARLRQWIETELDRKPTHVETAALHPNESLTSDRADAATDDPLESDRAEGPANPTALYEHLLGATRQMVYIVDEEGVVRVVSESLADRLGYTVETLCGKPLSEVLRGEEFETAATEVSSLLEAVRRTETGESYPVRTMTLSLETKNGATFPAEVELSLLPIDGSAGMRGVVGVVRDVSELEATRRQLRAQRDRFRELYENLPDAVTEVEFVDGDPIIRSVNGAFEETFGYDEATLRGRSTNDYIVPETQQTEASDIDEQVAAGDVENREIVRETVEGRRTFLFRGVSFEHDGERRGFGVYTDITERRNRERYHEVINRVLRHNLRNDLNVILGLADELVETVSETDGTSRPGSDGTPLETGDRLMQRIMDLAETSKQARQLESVIGPNGSTQRRIDATTLVSSVCERYETRFPEVELSCSLPDRLEVVGDGHLEAAVSQLVENAIVHNRSAKPTVSISGDRAEETVSIRVRDDGPGIPSDEQQVLLGDREITQLDHTSGLGLWIAKWIVESYGGQLRFGDPPSGALVELRLQTPRVGRE